MAEDLEGAQRRRDGRAVIAFNRMADWGADGRIVPGAPVYSPLIHRRKNLALE